MGQPQISDQGYLEPVTRLVNCHFGQLIHTCHICMFCHRYEQLTCSDSNCFQQQLGTLGNMKTSQSTLVLDGLLDRPIYFTMKLIFSDS
jgi:hypothetical protein